MASLSEFTAEIRNRNLARPYLYYVEIFVPTIIQTGKTQYNSQMINMFCSSAQTPFTAMFTNDSYNENGIKRKYIYDYDYQPLLLQFYVDQGYETKNFFDVWMQQIVPSDRKFNFYEDYVSPLIRVTIINTGGDDTYQYYYMNAVPKTVSNIDLNYGGHGSVSTFNVEFVFETMWFNKVYKNQTSVAPPTNQSGPTDNLEIAQNFGLIFDGNGWD